MALLSVVGPCDMPYTFLPLLEGRETLDRLLNMLNFLSGADCSNNGPTVSPCDSKKGGFVPPG